MPTYRRILGLLTLPGLLGVLIVCHAAEPGAESLRGDSSQPAVPVQGVPLMDPLLDLPEAVVWEKDTPQALQAIRKAVKSARVSKAAQREALIEQVLPILASTKSSGTFLMALEILAMLETPPEKVVPICLKAVERIDQYRPMPSEENESQKVMLEGIGDCLRLMMEKHVRVRDREVPMATWSPGMVPNAQYLEHSPQYFPPAPPAFPPAFPNNKEALQPARLPEPAATCPAPQRVPLHTEPVPVQFGVPLQMPVPKQLPATVPVPNPMAMPQVSASPIPTTLPMPRVMTVAESGIIPVSTLPPALPLSLEPVPTAQFQPNRLIPIPTLPAPGRDVRPCEPR